MRVLRVEDTLTSVSIYGSINFSTNVADILEANEECNVHVIGHVATVVGELKVAFSEPITTGREGEAAASNEDSSAAKTMEEVVPTDVQVARTTEEPPTTSDTPPISTNTVVGSTAAPGEGNVKPNVAEREGENETPQEGSIDQVPTTDQLHDGSNTPAISIKTVVGSTVAPEKENNEYNLASAEAKREGETDASFESSIAAEAVKEVVVSSSEQATTSSNTSVPTKVPPSPSRRRTQQDRPVQNTNSADNGVVASANTVVFDKGIPNLGQTCYMGASIQGLAHIPELNNFFNSDECLARIMSSTDMQQQGRVAYALRTVLAQFQEPVGYVNLRYLKKVVDSYNKKYWRYEPHDSSEYMRDLLQMVGRDIHAPFTEEEEETLSIVENLGTIYDDLGLLDKSAHKWDKYRSLGNNNMITDLMHGQLLTTVVCSVCKYKSQSFEGCSNLNLSVEDDDGTFSRLHECLMHFTRNEKMEGKEGYKCPRCNIGIADENEWKIGEATQNVRIIRFPTVMVIELKKFTFDTEYQSVYIQAPIAYPVKNLDLEPFASREKEEDTLFEVPKFITPSHVPPIYDLFSVVNYLPLTRHYTATCQSLSNKEWFYFDDSTVEGLGKNYRFVKDKSEGYVLFYRLRGVKPLF